MPLTFYPSDDVPEKSTLPERIETLMEAAEHYKGVVLDAAAKQQSTPIDTTAKRSMMTPREMNFAFNWDEVSRLLRNIRELPEITQPNRQLKSDYLTKLAEIYELLRAAKMPKLEAVRLALINEANQLKASGGIQVA